MKSCRRGGCNGVTSELPDKGSLSPEVFRQVDAVCMAFEAAWQAGGQPQLEAYLGRVQEPAHSVLVRELILLDLEYRHRAGERPTVDSYCVRLPEDAGVVRSVFSELDPSAPSRPTRPERLQVQLEVIAGPRRGDRFLLSGHEAFVVGRSQQAHLQVAKGDKYFSRVHFVIEINPPCCRLCDTGSTNGTKVNGRRVEAVDLAEAT